MTVLVGIKCEDGIVIGTDSAATNTDSLLQPTVEAPTKKLFLIQDKMLLAFTGAVGLGQRLIHIIEDNFKKGELKGLEATPFMTKITTLACNDFLTSHAMGHQNGKAMQGDVGALLASNIKGLHC